VPRNPTRCQVTKKWRNCLDHSHIWLAPPRDQPRVLSKSRLFKSPPGGGRRGLPMACILWAAGQRQGPFHCCMVTHPLCNESVARATNATKPKTGARLPPTRRYTFPAAAPCAATKRPPPSRREKRGMTVTRLLFPFFRHRNPARPPAPRFRHAPPPSIATFCNLVRSPNPDGHKVPSFHRLFLRAHRYQPESGFLPCPAVASGAGQALVPKTQDGLFWTRMDP
jgi:hypothetical protein